MKLLRIILWLAVLVAGLLLLFLPRPDDRATIKSSGDSLGGDYILTSHKGEKISSSDFKGSYQLIYFGYSFCPDVCPLELTKITTALTKLSDSGYDISAVKPLFITVDPERDTVEELAKYMTGFHPSFIGLTGSVTDIKAVAKDYKIYFSKGQDEGGFYLMNHSDVIYLMGKDGEFLKLFSSMDAPADIAATLSKLLKRK